VRQNLSVQPLSDSPVGPLELSFTLASLQPRVRQQAYSLFRALGINDKFPGPKNICENLLPLLADDAALQAPLARCWARWRYINLQVLSKGNTSATALVGPRLLTDYPVVMCIQRGIQSRGNDRLGQQVLRLKQLLLAGSMLREHKLSDTECVDKAAQEIRLACDCTIPRVNLLKKFPDRSFGLNYLYELTATIASLSKGRTSDNVSQNFLRVIRRLTETVLLEGHLLKAKKIRKSAAVENALSPLGKVEISIDDSSQSIAGDAEPVDMLKEPVTEPGGELSKKAFKATGLQTLYFLAQVESGVLWQRGRISPLEWPDFQKLLRSLPALIGHDGLTANEALMTGLVASTGLDPEDLLPLKLGDGGDISWAGTYKRQIPFPESAFDPFDAQEEARELYQSDPVNEVILSLPDPIQALLKTASQTAPQQTLTIGDLFGLTPNQPGQSEKTVRRLRKVMGVLLRTHVNRRLTYRHLRTVLRHATYEQAHDALFVYLLAARPKLAPPVQMYYAGVTVARLKEVHQAVMRLLFGS